MAGSLSAVVVGAGPGLGGAVAKRFAKGGFPVALVSRSPESTRVTVDEITKAGGKAVAYTADAASPEQVDETFKRIEAELGPVGVLVYNVGGGGGTWPPPAFEDLPLEAFKRGLDNSAVGAFLWSKKVIPGLKARGQGTLLYTGATASLRGGAKFAAFSPGKFALRSLSQTLAREYGPSGIHVAHIIVDGVIDTPRTAAWGGSGGDNKLNPDAIAETYWHLHLQHKSAWTHEIDIRPYVEKF